MFIIENGKGKRKAQQLEKYVDASPEFKNITVLDRKGKKIIKKMDKETFNLKFG